MKDDRGRNARKQVRQRPASRRVDRLCQRAERRCGRRWSPRFSGSDGCGLGREAGDRQRPCCCGRRLAHALAPSLRTPVAIALAVVVTLIGIPAATQVARGSGIKDPQFVVIDEVAGQLVALVAVPLAWKSFLAGFILFRVFDIVKPPPVRQLEALPEGAGIVLDDIAAGLYALGIDASLVALWSSKIVSSEVVRVFSSWDSPTASWARKA